MTLTMDDKADKSTSVLMLHDEALDPHPFLARLTGTEPVADGDVPWSIDNKYYTAAVTLEPRPLSLPVNADYPVLLYIFSGQAPDPLPADLTRLVVRDPPPDITLAVRVADVPELGDDVARSAGGALDEEVFDELGMEVVDELGGADEDDERPLDPLETVRQTLMTHMWPNMVRKPAPGAASRSAPRPEISVTAEDSDGDGDAATDAALPQGAAFPVLFANHTGPPPATRQGTASDFPTPEPRPRSGRSDSSDDDAHERDGDGDGRGAYEPMLEDGDGEFGEFGEFAAPSDEFARLDQWLEDDGDDLAALGRLRALADGSAGMSAADLGADLGGFGGFSGLGGLGGLGGSGLGLPPASAPDPGFSGGSRPSARADPSHGASGDGPAANGAANGGSGGGSGFEDDFGPPAARGGTGDVPLDPTPLLLHLQNVRAELADVADEDERRVRAAREVAALMGQLGFGDGELGLDELELEFDDDV